MLSPDQPRSLGATQRHVRLLQDGDRQRSVLVVAAVSCLGGCGVTAQDGPEPIGTADSLHSSAAIVRQSSGSVPTATDTMKRTSEGGGT